MSIRGNLATGLASFHAPPSCDESSRAGRLFGLVELTDGFQCKSDVVPASPFYKDNLGNISSCFFFLVRATSPGLLRKVQPQAYGLTGRFSSQFCPEPPCLQGGLFHMLVHRRVFSRTRRFFDASVNVLLYRVSLVFFPAGFLQ